MQPFDRLADGGLDHLQIEAVELRQAAIDERVIGVEKVIDRAIRAEQLAEEERGLLAHRRLEIVGVVDREFVHVGRHRAELAEGEPAVEEFVHEGIRARVGEEPLGLRAHRSGLRRVTCGALCSASSGMEDQRK